MLFFNISIKILLYRLAVQMASADGQSTDGGKIIDSSRVTVLFT